MMPVCLITGDANFDHLVKVVSTMILHYKCLRTYKCFRTKTHLMGRYLRLCKYTISHMHVPNNCSMH